MGQYGEAGKGALGGAAQGAVYGSAIPGIGTIGGALIGGALGGISGWMGNEDEERQKQLIEEYKKGMNSSFRGDQQQLIDRLKMQATGQGPSMANLQMTNSMDKNNASMSAMAQSGRGNAGAAAQAAMNAGATSNMGIAAQAGVARLDEAQRANELIGMNANQGRMGDMQAATNLHQAQSGQVGKPSQGDMLLASGLSAANAWAANRAQSQAQKVASAEDEVAAAAAAAGRW